MSAASPTAGLSRTPRPAPPSHLRRNIAAAGVIVVFIWSALGVDLSIAKLLDLPSGLASIFDRMFLRGGPDWDYLGPSLVAMMQSIQIAWVGTIIGAIFSLPIGFLAAKNVSSGPISTAMRLLLNGIRAFPELVLAVAIFIPIAGLGPEAGALAIGFHSIGTLGKLTAEAIESISNGPVEAARAAGANALQVQRWGVLPQVLPEIVAFWLYRFEINIRAAAVLGVVGAGGIGLSLQQTIVYGRYDKAGMALIVIIVSTILVDTVSGWVRRRIIEGTEQRATQAEVFEPVVVAPTS